MGAVSASSFGAPKACELARMPATQKAHCTEVTKGALGI